MPEKLTNIAVFISGRGTGLQSLIDAAARGELSVRIVLVVSSTADAYGLERAKKHGIDTLVYAPRAGERPAATEQLIAALQSRHVQYVALAGFLKLIPTRVLELYPHRVVNIHPALLPKYGGKGMYGHHVHQAVIDANEVESGVTIHLVDEIYDHGIVLEQVKVPVHKGDTPETLAERVLSEEHKLYPKALQKLITGKYTIPDGKHHPHH